jgi:hypothetical protein
MPQFFANRQVIPSSSSGSQQVAASPFGALHGMDWRSAAVLSGKGFHVTIGALSTPITGGGAGTILDLDQPEGIISVPLGTSIQPIRIHVQALQPLIATDADESEILIAVDRTAKWAVDGTRTDETIFNMRTDIVGGSNCVAASAFTADTTDPVLDIELARSIYVADSQSAVGVVNTKHELLYEPVAPPLIVGPAMIVIYWGGTVATPGFAEIQWVEMATPSTS